MLAFDRPFPSLLIWTSKVSIPSSDLKPMTS
jgi:hypothetical protein